MSLSNNCKGFLDAAERNNRSEMQRLLPQGIQQGLRGFLANLSIYDPDIYDEGVRAAIEALDLNIRELVETAPAIDLVGLRDAVRALGAWARGVHDAAVRALRG